jgi:hypothetical protein
MPPCTLCGLDRKLIKAHAVPEAFFRELRVNGEVPVLVSGEQGRFLKKAPIGVYDEGILCEVCEPTFGAIDDYGINVLLKDFGTYFKPLSKSGETAGFESTTADPSRLLQFLVSVLWRASMSTHPFYSKVALGPMTRSHAWRSTHRDWSYPGYLMRSCPGGMRARTFQPPPFLTLGVKSGLG